MGVQIEGEFIRMILTLLTFFSFVILTSFSSTLAIFVFVLFKMGKCSLIESLGNLVKGRLANSGLLFSRDALSVSFKCFTEMLLGLLILAFGLIGTNAQ